MISGLFFSLMATSFGESPIPSSVPDSYVDSSGSTVKLSDSDKTAFKLVYSKANPQISSLMRSSSYKSMTDKEKAAAIRAAYTAYYESAKAKAYKDYDPKTKTASLATTGVDLGDIEAAVVHIKGIKATSTKTRKELVLSYVNSLSIPQGQRYLILYLSGFGLGDEAESSTLKYLISKGMSRSDAKTFLGMD